MIELDNLFEEWKEKHKSAGHKYFISDGIVNEAEWENVSPKICFFLKEAYSRDGSSWSLTKWINNGALVRMWNKVAEWTNGLLHTTSDFIPKYSYIDDKTKSKCLKSISIVNTKKSDGLSNSDWNDLLFYAQDDSKLLKQEIDLINPDIIICGYTGSLLRVVYGASVCDSKVNNDGMINADDFKKNGYAIVDGRIIIDYYHPANQFPNMLNYYTICSLYQQALKDMEKYKCR